MTHVSAPVPCADLYQVNRRRLEPRDEHLVEPGLSRVDAVIEGSKPVWR